MSSCRISSRSRSFTPTALTAAPPEGSGAENRLRSATTPMGVSMYLPLTARLTVLIWTDS